jgi:hypothetical protein
MVFGHTIGLDKCRAFGCYPAGEDGRRALRSSARGCGGAADKTSFYASEEKPATWRHKKEVLSGSALLAHQLRGQKTGNMQA